MQDLFTGCVYECYDKGEGGGVAGGGGRREGGGEGREGRVSVTCVPSGFTAF